MNQYEVMYVIDAALEDSARIELIGRFSDLVKKNGGEIDRVDEWGKRRLAYAINYKTEGYYVLHRIVRAEGDLLTLMGDGNIRGTEHCKRSDVIAKAIGFVRKGRNETDWTTGWKWTVYSWIWTRMLPLRRWLLLVWRVKQRLCAQ